MWPGLFVLCDLSQVIFQVRVSVWIAIGEVAAIEVAEIECEAEGVVVADGCFVGSLESTFVVADIGARSLPHEVSRLADLAAWGKYSHSVIE